jgi:hypothetical protein
MNTDGEDVIEKEWDMKKLLQAALVAVAVVAVPTMSLAAQPKAAKPGKSAMALHSAKGVVKSMDASSLVITEGSGAKAHDVQFVVDTTTAKDGAAVGSPVVVKYHDDGSRHVATMVSPAPAKATRHTGKK